MRSFCFFIFFNIFFSGFGLAQDSTQTVDWIILSANIYTSNPSQPKAEAMAIDKGKIVGLGSNKIILSHYKATKTDSLQGKTITAGMIDAHCHFYGYGTTLGTVNLVGTQSFEEVISKVIDFQKTNKRRWLTGRGWDQNDWKDQQFPNKDTLDVLFPNTPVLLRRIDGHAALANQKALDLAKISTKTSIEGGFIEQKNGKLTGILLDNAVDLVIKKIPKLNPKEQTDALLNAQQKCFEAGLTCVADAGLDLQTVQLIDKLQTKNKLQIKVYAMLNPNEENFEFAQKKGVYQTNRLVVRSFKVYGDGALGSRGAFLKQPYSDQADTKGFLLADSNYFRSMAQRCKNLGYQMNTHCIGDASNSLLLTIYSQMLDPKNDLRWRIEHAQTIDSVDFIKFKNYNIIPSVQPTHATSDMYWASKRLGMARLKTAYAYQTLWQQNGYLALGSDFPIEDINPLFGFHAATARQDANAFPDGGFQPENKLTREQALLGMTYFAAKSQFMENKIGQIKIGFDADFVVLDENLMTIDPKNIRQIKVLKTVINGQEVFSKESLKH